MAEHEPFIRAFALFVAGLTGLSVGQTLYAGHFPEGAPETASVLIKTGSQADIYQPLELVQRVQLTSRAKTYFESEGEALGVYQQIVGRIGWESSGWYIHSIVGGEPIPTGTDKKGRFTHTAHLTVRVRRMEA